MANSGKLLIGAILSVALLAAGFSWWFRFQATHRTAQFWGPAAARLIREAPGVEALEIDGSLQHITNQRDVSKAKGMTHLRYALLEDRSFQWPGDDGAELEEGAMEWRFALRFRNDPQAEPLILLFSEDFLWVATGSPLDVLSCEPIAPGLGLIFGELLGQGAKTQAERAR